MNSITRFFLTAAILLIALPFIAKSQSERDHAIIQILREVTLSQHGTQSDSRLRVFPGERYVGYQNDAVPAGARLINILDTIYHIPHSSDNPAYQTKGETHPNKHRAGLLKNPIITRLTKGGKEYYRLNVLQFKTYSDKVVIRTLRGSDILTFITQNQADIERSRLEPNTIIRISASEELTKFYDLPPYEEVEINRDYYQVFIRKDNVECFWEKESGFLYELSGNELLHIRTATKNNPIIEQGIGQQITMFIGKELESESFSQRRDGISFFSFNADYFSLFKDNLIYVLVVIILLVIIIIVLFNYYWMAAVVSKGWQRFSVFVFPTFTHVLDSNDTLYSLSDKFKVEFEEILKHNPNIVGIKPNSKLQRKSIKTVKIPKTKKFISRDTQNINGVNIHKEIEGSKEQDYPCQNANRNNLITIQETNKVVEGFEPTDRQYDTITNDKVLHQLMSIEQKYLAHTKQMVLEIKNKIESGTKEQEKQKKQIETLTEEKTRLNELRDSLVKEKEELSRKHQDIVAQLERYIYNVYIFRQNAKVFQEIYPFIDVWRSVSSIIDHFNEALKAYKYYDAAYFVIIQILNKFFSNANYPDWTSSDWETLENGLVTKKELINIASKQGEELFIDYLKYEFFKSIYALSNSGIIMLEEAKNIEFISSVTNESIRRIQTEASNSKNRMLGLLDEGIGLSLANIELFRERQQYDATFSLKSSSDEPSPYLSTVSNQLKRDQILEIQTLRVMAFRQKTISLTSKYSESKVIIHA